MTDGVNRVELSKVSLMESIIRALYEVIVRRSVYRFDKDPIEKSMKHLTTSFPFFSQIQIVKAQYINQVPTVQVLNSINKVSDREFRDAIDSLLRQISYEVYDEIGLYFINEFIDSTGSKVKDAIIDFGVDLHQLQLELHDAYILGKRSRFDSEVSLEKPEQLKDSANQIDYTWKDVSYWKHEPGSVFCNLFDGEGNIIDRINLDRVIKNYIEILSGERDLDPEELEQSIHVYEKEYNLLRLMFEQDMGAEVAMSMLHISKQELDELVKKLHKMNLVQYVSDNTVKLTDKAMDYISFDEKMA